MWKQKYALYQEYFLHRWTETDYKLKRGNTAFQRFNYPIKSLLPPVKVIKVIYKHLHLSSFLLMTPDPLLLMVSNRVLG